MKYTLIFLILSLWVVTTSAKTEEVGNYIIRHYTDDIYSAHHSNWCVLKGDDGSFYFGNRSVVVVFDGTTWSKVEIKLDASVRSLQKNKQGRIYVGATGDFGYLDRNQSGELLFHSMRHLLPKENQEFGDIWKIHIQDEAVYFQSNEGLFKWENGQFTIWKSQTKYHFSFLVNNELYIKDNSLGLLKMVNDSLVVMDAECKGEDVNSHIYSMLPYDQDHVLMITRGMGAYLLKSVDVKSSENTIVKKRLITSDEAILLSSQIYGGTKLSNGNYAINTLNNGILLMKPNGEITQQVAEKNQLIGQIRDVFQDEQNALWVASNRGIYRLAYDVPLTYWDQKNGLKGSLSNMIEYNDTQYVATSAGVYYMENNHFHPVSGIDYQSWKFQLIDFQGRKQLFVATDGGVFQIHKKTATKIINEKCRSIFHSNLIDNYLWVAKTNSVVFYERRGENWYLKGKIPDFDNYVIDIKEDTFGNLWMSTANRGIIKLEDVANYKPYINPKIKLYGKEKGILRLGEPQIAFSSKAMYAISGHQLFSYDAGQDYFYPYSIKKEDQTDKELKSIFIAIDSVDNFWIQRNENDAKLWLEYAEPMTDSTFEISAMPFKMIPRMLARQVYMGEDIWFVLSDALFKYNFRKPYLKETKHEAILQRIVINQDSVYHVNAHKKVPTFSFPYLCNDLTFHFTSTSFRHEGFNQFKYRLSGENQKWSDWNNQPVAYFTNLSEGNYQFQIKARAFDETESEIVSYSFYIHPPWYRSITTYLFYVIAAIMLIWVIVKIYTRRVHQQNKLLEQKVLERTKEISHQNEQIKLQKDEIVNQNKELRLLNKEKNFLLGAVAHDLKTPLNSIYSVSQLIKMTGDLDNQEHREYIDQIESISLNLNDKVNEILDVSMLDAVNYKIPLKRAELSAVVCEVYKEFKPIATRKGIELIYENDDTKYFASFEKKYMKKSIENLLENAIKFSPIGKKVWITLVHPGEKLQIHVKDEGPGIADEDKKQLFKRFTTLTAKPTDGEKSTGLGLSIVKRYVEAMNGNVWCESTLGQGATFTIEI